MKAIDVWHHPVIPCYCENVKNITVSIPEEVYRRARIKAAESGTSVSALVRQFLNGLTERDSDFERRSRLQSDVIATIGRFRAGDRLRRDEVHARHALR